MNIEERYLTINPYSRTGEKLQSVKQIVVHWVGNSGSTAIANRNYFESLKDKHIYASSHYVVGLNGEIIKCIPEDEVAYHAGNRTVNRNSIGIENCHPDWDGKFNENTYNSLVELCVDICKRYNLGIDNIIRHYDVTHKICPAPFVNNEARWNDFKSRLVPKSDLQYKVHIQDKGWTDWKNTGDIAGTTGENKRIEAIILQGNNGLDLSYRVHMQDKGWSDWIGNGQVAGTTGEGRRIEAIEIKSNKRLEVQEHIQDVGWMPKSSGTEIHLGTKGKCLKIEAFKINVV